MSDNKFEPSFKVLRTIKDKYKSFGFNKSKKSKTDVYSLSKEKDSICRRIHNKQQTKTQFPKLTKSTRIFKGGKSRKSGKSRRRRSKRRF